MICPDCGESILSLTNGLHVGCVGVRKKKATKKTEWRRGPPKLGKCKTGLTFDCARKTRKQKEMER